MNVFDFVNAINYSKNDLFEDPQAEKDYVPFIVNKSLSYFPDTVLFANEVNTIPNIPKRWQFDFLRHSIHPRKRFSKWVKKPQSNDDISAVCNYYKYSIEKAMDVIPLLNETQILTIKHKLSKGGNHDE